MVIPINLGCSAPFFTWSDNCTRSYFESFPTLVFVVFLLFRSLPWPENGPLRDFSNAVKSPFTLFLSLNEAEAILNPELAAKDVQATKVRAPIWCTATLATLALGEAVSWLTIGSYNVIASNGTVDYRVLTPYINAAAWLFAVIIPIFEPQVTVPYKLFIFYVLQLIAGVFQFGSIWYDHDIFGIPLRTVDVVGGSLNLFVVLTLLIIVLRMPLSVPTNDEIAEKIVRLLSLISGSKGAHGLIETCQGTEVSPEDYAPLWKWITFEWILPLIRKGTHETLNEPDIWNLSPTMQSKAVYEKFISLKRRTLLRRIFASNSLDLILDFTLTVSSVVFNYAQPYFLNLLEGAQRFFRGILESLEQQNNPEARSRAYIYAFLSFLATLLQGEADLQHLWYGRRATTRIRSSLMAAIYAKALVRKDFSGIIDKKQGEENSGESGSQSHSRSPSAASASERQPLLNGDSKKGGKTKKKEEDPKNTSGADVGKIVNLMSGDANRLAMTVSGAYYIYSAPFELVIASVFLYQLLGVSAFAGFACLIVATPLNSFLAKRRIRIFKGVLAARDKRMGLVNELLSAVKLVKFYAWENRWMDRVLDARKFELKWLVKSRTNQVFFSLLWSSVPIFVSVVSFLAYVLTGHELSIPVAFTSIALFNMLRCAQLYLRAPLNVIPTWIVQILQTKVSLDRIAVYLDEDEVSDEMSALKHGPVDPSLPDDDRLGILNGSFKWNEVAEEEKEKEKEKTGMKGRILNLFKKRKSTPSDSETDPGDSVSVTGQRPEDRKFELRDINIVFPEGKLTLVTGPTASGKSALLMALLGEMTMLPGNGKILLPKHRSRPDQYGNKGISYAAQTPYLQHQSIRENILFGTPYDEERYEQILESCALKPDLKIFEDGDLTEVGSRGISLSGGQKARVALARAVYAHSQCVLLDDPLSAVDSHTALSLYENLLKGPLLANRTVVLVSHNVELVLPGADYLVRLLDGRIDAQGTPDDLRKEGLLDILTKDSHADSQNKLHDAKDEAAVEEAGKPANDDSKRPRQLVKDEARETGGVKWQIYKTYLKASGYHTWVLLAFGIVLYEILGVAEKLWIKQWGEGYDAPTAMHYFMSNGDGDWDFSSPPAMRFFNALRNTTQPQIMSTTAINLPSATTHPLFYVGIYAAISFGSTIVYIGSVIVQYNGALRGSRIIFKDLLVAVVRATMRWHDSTPTGRILNRFSKDVETIDTSLGFSLQAVNSSMATLFASVFTVIVFSPPFILPAIIIGYTYYRLGIGYLNTGRDLRRMESNSRSPIFSNFSELLIGIVTVRAFSSERRFLDNLHLKVDATTKMWYSFWMTNRWLLLHFDFLGGLAVLFTTLLALLGAIGSGYAGVTITSAMAFTSSKPVFTGLFSSVERVVEYLELPQEPPLAIENSRPPAFWPSGSDNEALIAVKDLVVSYGAELPPVLHGVSFTLKAGERVGLLGRTGSGKSTLAMSLLRFTDPTSGTIHIDGIDITKIGLHDLRSRLTFVAQDAVLFSGTVRENIDPFNDYSDAECLDVLSRVHLITDSRQTSRLSSRAPSIHEVDQDETIAASSTVSATAAMDEKIIITLDTKVSTGGSNFSQGQRQLLTMARALLRQSSIIILDEATSSIDFATDAKIQKTIRDEFAHRLRTIIDYDRLIVLDNGRIVEFDTPYNLIQKENGGKACISTVVYGCSKIVLVFRGMCMHSGSFKELEDAATAAEAKRNGKELDARTLGGNIILFGSGPETSSNNLEKTAKILSKALVIGATSVGLKNIWTARFVSVTAFQKIDAKAIPVQMAGADQEKHLGGEHGFLPYFIQRSYLFKPKHFN
ncbi:hypothetical protein Clacol_004573 [Clathrus columnatus]|uniref:Uncharacterized protein n=1 Tax=Clathrus columnatus TaxID=1419009 RepID=A0AAV5A9U6_9AGAM|nr:hypothetical protein Clacol_004573 [Clathrus columnatus]